MGAFRDLSGMRFGRMSVIERAENRGRRVRWLCVCDCGERRLVASDCLVTGNTKSCGCARTESLVSRNKASATHGMCESTEHNSWNAMISRCYRESAASHRRYKSLGIKVCDRWRESFSAFLEDMGPKPSPDHTIDRVNYFGDYEPGNCRWATWKEQARNKITNVRVKAFGKTKCLADWAEYTGVKRCTVNRRNKRGWSPGIAVFKGAKRPITFKVSERLLNG